MAAGLSAERPAPRIALALAEICTGQRASERKRNRTHPSSSRSSRLSSPPPLSRSLPLPTLIPSPHSGKAWWRSPADRHRIRSNSGDKDSTKISKVQHERALPLKSYRARITELYGRMPMSANRPAAHSDADSTSPQLRPPPPGRPVLPMAPAGPASSRRLEGITTVKPLQLLAAALTDCCATANPGRHRCQRSRRRRRRRMEKGDEKKRRRKKPYRFLLTVQNEPGF